jgi:cell division protein FtsA
MYRQRVVTALDLGSSRIKAAAAEVADGRLASILGVVSLPMAGVRKGNVVDIESAALAVAEALSRLEKMSGLAITHATAGFSGAGIETVRHISAVTIGREGRIRLEDRNRALFSAQNILVPAGRAILQIVENKYRIDGSDAIKDPIGMSGQRLELDALLVLASVSARANLLLALEQAETPLDIVYNPVLQAESVLTATEKDAGVALADLGAATTDVTVFQNGAMVHSAVLPVGADHITSDLAIVFQLPFDEAQRLKENNAFLFPPEKDFLCPVKNLQGKEEALSGHLISQVVASRVDEIADMIGAQLYAGAGAGYLPGGIVLTGGGARLAHIIDYYQALFGFPVRLGESQIDGLAAEYGQAEFTAVLGNLLFQSLNLDSAYAGHRLGLKVNKAVRSIHAWVREILR